MYSGPDEEELRWLLLYTKPRAEAWAELNLRRQGYEVLMPRVAAASGLAPLFPRYLFVGSRPGEATQSLRSTLGVLYVVKCGDQPARVTSEVIAGLRQRMGAHGVVRLDAAPAVDPLFARRERERVRALVKLAQAGFRVRAA